MSDTAESGAATRWAARIRPVDLASRIDELDRRALSVDPSVLQKVELIAADAAAAAIAVHRARLTALQAEDPAAAALVEPRGGRTFAAIAGVIAAAAAYAFFFSRGDVGRSVEAVAAAVAVTVSAVCSAAAMLPMRRDRPVGDREVFLSWTIAVLGALAAVASIAISSAANTLGWEHVVIAVAAAASVVLAVTATVRRAATPRAVRGGSLERAERLVEELRDDARDIRSNAAQRVLELLTLMEPADRSHAESDLAGAYTVLERRGLVVADATPHAPGLLLIDLEVAHASTWKDGATTGRLVPALAPTSG